MERTGTFEAHYLVITGYKYDDYLGGGPRYRVRDPALNEFDELPVRDWSSIEFGVTFVGQGLFGWVDIPIPYRAITTPSSG